MSPTIKEFADRAISPNTRLAYEKALGRFRDWLRTRKLKLNDSSLAEYLISIYKAGLSYATCAQCVAAVKWMTRETRSADLVGNTTGLVLQGIARSGKRGYGQVKGLPWDQVDQVVDMEFRKGTSAGFRNAAMFAVASDAMLRVSEIRAVEIDDIELNTDEEGFSVLTIPRSKTDQKWIGEKAAELANEHCRRKMVGCQRNSRGKSVSPTLKDRKRRRTESNPHHSSKDHQELDRRGRAEEGRYSGHSLRVGTDLSLAEHGWASLVELTEEIRWKSARVAAYYASDHFALRSATARLDHGLQTSAKAGQSSESHRTSKPD